MVRQLPAAMDRFAKMSEFVHTLSQLYRTQLERYRNRGFLCAAMAGCALVSMASGSVSFRKRVRVDSLLETLDALRVFDPHEGVEMFDEFASAIKADPEAGRRQALDVIRKEVAHEPEKARLLGRICLAVSGRDGEIPGVELREVASLCQELGLDPLSCGLGEIGNPGTAPRED
jgi:tellurite resistance protein TerB